MASLLEEFRVRGPKLRMVLGKDEEQGARIMFVFVLEITQNLNLEWQLKIG